ncbi:MAG: hypothetical protein LBC76_07515 [Treponema sp.]|jgi:hypothetical protein|nr:hypothetical protein [Treponema sp.]
MKKIVVFAVILLIVSASLFASGQNEGKYSIDDFQGTWQQVNGSSVITITGNDFTILNMEIGYAGYGIVSMDTWNENNVKRETIRFDFNNEGKGRSTKGNFFYLGKTEEDLNQYKENPFFKNILVNDFQMKAWEEFSPKSEKNSRYPDDIIKKYFNIPLYQKGSVPQPCQGSGYTMYYFDLNGDNLKLEELNKKASYSVESSYVYYLLFAGEFERVK